jgi:hypothetical protein
MNFFKKTSLLCLIFLSIFFLVNYGLATDRPLEVVYPQIPGAPKLETVTAGLPEYVAYIFYFAVITIGFIIFGVLVYGGVLYLTSIGNPERLSEAKKSMLSGILGAIILLSAYLIFYTIDPHLVILDIAEIDPLAPMLFPGLYVCNYRDDAIQGILANYLQRKDTAKRIEAARELKKIMSPVDGSFCRMFTSSTNFPNFVVKGNKNTFFVIPKEIFKPGEIRYLSEYNIILHERDNFGGRCHIPIKENLYPEGMAGGFAPRVGHFGQLNFTARSFTLFRQSPGGGEITLYSCYHHEHNICPPNVDPVDRSFSVGGAAKEIQFVAAGDLENLKNNVRSIRVNGNAFAVIYDKADAQNNTRCEVISRNVFNLSAHPIGQCGRACNVITRAITERACYPCIESAHIINGERI